VISRRFSSDNRRSISVRGIFFKNSFPGVVI
jgi:hypothetical protein